MLTQGFEIEKLAQRGVQLVVLAVLGEIPPYSFVVLSTFDEGEVVNVLCQLGQLHRVLCLGVFCQRPQLVQINVCCVNGGGKAVDAEDILVADHLPEAFTPPGVINREVVQRQLTIFDGVCTKSDKSLGDGDGMVR